MNRLPPPAASRRTLVGLAAGAAVGAVASGRTAVQGVLAVRDGWGCARMLPHLDSGAIGRSPKVLVGSSDPTAVLLPEPDAGFGSIRLLAPAVR